MVPAVRGLVVGAGFKEEVWETSDQFLELGKGRGWGYLVVLPEVDVIGFLGVLPVVFFGALGRDAGGFRVLVSFLPILLWLEHLTPHKLLVLHLKVL